MRRPVARETTRTGKRCGRGPRRTNGHLMTWSRVGGVKAAEVDPRLVSPEGGEARRRGSRLATSGKKTRVSRGESLRVLGARGQPDANWLRVDWRGPDGVQRFRRMGPDE